MVFCAVEGPFDFDRLKKAALAAKGVERSSVRLSRQPGALSFALDPNVRTVPATLDVLRRSLPPGVSLTVVSASTTLPVPLRAVPPTSKGPP